MTQSPSIPGDLEALRSFIRALPDSGAHGFEGLVRTMAEEITDVPMRIASSGDQRGSDAAGPDGNRALRIEAKNYDRSPPKRDLLGNLTQALTDDPPEVWVLASTAEIGDQAVTALHHAGAARHCQVVILDWAVKGHRLPPLARLVVASWPTLRTWAESAGITFPPGIEKLLPPGEDRNALRAALRNLLTPSIVTYEGTRRDLVATSRAALADRTKAQSHFRQAMVPLSTDEIVIARPDVLQAIDEAAGMAQERNCLCAVLGDEGVGKSWAVATYWTTFHPDTPFLFISSRDLVSPQSAEEAMEARLSALTRKAETGRPRVETFLRKAAERGQPATVVIDGLNENLGMDWGRFLPDLRALLCEWGARLVVTCRPRTWQEHFEGRFEAVSVEVPVFGRTELERFFEKAGIAHNQVPDDIQDGLANPRYCQLAVRLGRQVGFEGLTKERVLWAYWKSRREEANGLSLTDREFHRLLAQHASRVRDNFAAAASLTRSTIFSVADLDRPAPGVPAHSIKSDLSEIIEGRYFQPLAGDESDYYGFRESGPLLFALGLGLVDELRDPRQAETVEERIGRYVDPIAALDNTTRILISAMAVSALQERPDLVTSLIKELLSLQNRDFALATLFTAYIGESFEGYAQAAEDHVLVNAVDEWLVLAMRRALRIDTTRAAAYAACSAWLENRRREDVDPVAREQVDPDRDTFAVGLLTQFAANCLAGFALAPLKPSIRERALALSPRRDGREDAVLLSWLDTMNRSDPSGADPIIPLQTDDGGAPPMAADDDADEILSFCVTRFSGCTAEDIVKRLGALPSQMGSPFADASAARYLEAGLAALPPDRRVAALMTFALPDTEAERDRSWNARLPWRPRLPDSDITEWLRSTAASERDFNRAVYYLASADHHFTAGADEVLADMICEHPGEAAAALHLAASWEAPRAAAAFASSGWMPLEEEDDRRRLTGMRLLARLDGRNGTYEERRSRISGGVLPRALSHAAPGEVERVLADLLEATSAMVAFSAGDRSVPAGPSLDRTGAIAEKDLQSFVKLEALSPIAAKRLVEHPKAVERLVKQMVEYARSDSGRSEPDAFALSLVPVASSVAPELGNDLAEAIFARDLSRRRIDKARGRSGRLQDAVAYLILADTERSRRLLDDFIAASPDDGAFLSLVKAAAQSDAHDRLTAAARRGMASSSTADQMRGALIAALVGDTIKEGSRVAAKRLAAPIASRRQEVIELLEEWRGAAGDAKLAVERRLFQSSPPLPPHIAISDDHAAAQLLGDRLQEWAEERRASSHDRLFGAKAPPAWLAHLNIRPFGA